ncbi:T6SS immunity protein Tli3 family protein [Burkholderia sp. MR1-5-21]
MNRYFLRAISALSLVLLTACSLLIPPGIPSGMTNPAARGTPISSYPERLVYRIDDHRYITIQGSRNCAGMIWYYDTRLGVRTDVAASGLTLGNGAYSGYYAIDSDYVVIPVIEFSQIRGSLLYIYYSNDEGQTFKSFLLGGYSMSNDGVLVKGSMLYSMDIRRKLTDFNPLLGYVDPKKLPPVTYEDMDMSQVNVFNMAEEIKTEPYRWGARGKSIASNDVPRGIRSPSGKSRWICGEIVNENK